MLMNGILALRQKVANCKILWLSLLLLCVTGCCYPARYDGPYRGKIVDAETGSPIEGVVVLGVWYKTIATAAGGVSSYYDADETVTNKDGQFEIKGKGLRILTNIGPMSVVIFKSGYQYIHGPWESHKYEGGLMKNKAKVEGDRVIMPLKKLTMEASKEQGTPSFPSFQSDSERNKKIPLFMKELNKEEIRMGRPPYPER